jgi:hypothetical protein
MLLASTVTSALKGTPSLCFELANSRHNATCAPPAHTHVQPPSRLRAMKLALTTQSTHQLCYCLQSTCTAAVRG